MSDTAHAHGHGHNAPDHVPHVSPLWIYLATWATLVVLTAITVGASYVNFGGWNLIIALLIATIKAGVVAALFMHLLHDHKFHTLVLISGGLFLIIFVAFTMFDTEFRGKADAQEGQRPADITRPFEGTKAEMEMKQKFQHGAAAATATAPPGQVQTAPTGSAAASNAPAAASASAAPAESAAASASASAAPSGSASAMAAPSASAPASASAAPAHSGSAAPSAHH